MASLSVTSDLKNLNGGRTVKKLNMSGGRGGDWVKSKKGFIFLTGKELLSINKQAHHKNGQGTWTSNFTVLRYK